MNYVRGAMVVCILLSCALSLSAESQREFIQQKPQQMPTDEDVKKGMDEAHAAIFNPTMAALLIKKKNFPGASVEDKNFYCIIHVLRWTNPDKDQKQTVQTQNWYIYRGGQWSQDNFHTAKRLYGVRKFWFLFIHLNKDSSSEEYEARYEFEITKKTPANLANLFALIQLGSGEKINHVQQTENVWGGGEIRVDYKTSNITITPKLARITQNTTSTTYEALGDPQTFDNEGNYYWDVSVGVPVRRIREVQFDSVANTVSPKTIDRQNIYGLLNLFPRPVDIKGTNFSYWPHLVSGLAVAKQPLHKIFLGGGWGPHFAHFYLGALWVQQQSPATLQSGATATPDQLKADLRLRYKAQVSFGINLPVRGVVDTLKKANK